MTLSTDQAKRPDKLLRFEELPADRRLFMLATRLEEHQLADVSGNLTERQALDWLEANGWKVCGAQWADGAIGAVIWPTWSGEHPDDFDCVTAYVAACRVRTT